MNMSLQDFFNEIAVIDDKTDILQSFKTFLLSSPSALQGGHADNIRFEVLFDCLNSTDR